MSETARAHGESERESASAVPPNVVVDEHTAVVEFYFRTKLRDGDDVLYVRSKDVGEDVGLTTKQTANAIRTLTADDDLNVWKWSSPTTNPARWGVRYAE